MNGRPGDQMNGTISTGVFVKGQTTTQGEINNKYIRCGVCDTIVQRLGKLPLSEDIQREIKPFMHVNGMCKECLGLTLNPKQMDPKTTAAAPEPWRTSITTTETRLKKVA